MSRRRGRVDANQAAIVAALRGLGWYVFDAAGVGQGFPDLVIARAGRVVLVEVKDGSKPLSRQALTPAEALVHRSFAAAGVPVRLIRSVDQVVGISGARAVGGPVQGGRLRRSR